MRKRGRAGELHENPGLFKRRECHDECGATIFNEEDGAAAIEYALIASAIAVVIATAAFTLGGNIRNMFNRLANLIR